MVACAWILGLFLGLLPALAIGEPSTPPQAVQPDELEDGRYGSRAKGMYKWQRNREHLRERAVEAKARMMGISVEEVQAQESVKALDDPRKAGEIEGDYGKRSGHYAWQRDRDEVKRKADEARTRLTRAFVTVDSDPLPTPFKMDGAEPVEFSWLKYAEPRAWYSSPRLCDQLDARELGCKVPALGMRVKALETIDLKPAQLKAVRADEPRLASWMDEMNGLAGTIVKLLSPHALVQFDAEDVAKRDSVSAIVAKFELRRKTKLTVGISPSSKSAGRLPAGVELVILEWGEILDEQRARCSQGWLSVFSATGKRNLRALAEGLSTEL